MAAGLREAGHPGYVRSDAAVMRLLARGCPISIGGLGAALGVTRQAARKVAAGLEQRGYARVERNRDDARRLDVTLTESGVAYARLVTQTLHRLDAELAARVEPVDLAAAKDVLRAVLAREGEGGQDGPNRPGAQSAAT